MPIVCADARLAAAPRYGRLFIPLGTLVTVWEFLRLNGSRGREQLAFLAGRAVVDGSAQVTSCVLPVTSANGGYVTLTSHAQTALILDTLEARRETFLMALHTHPDGGDQRCGPSHSEIDDHGVALTPDDGVFSAVIPHYALGSPFRFPDGSTIYERVDGAWRRLATDEVDERVVVHGETLRMVPAGAR